LHGSLISGFNAGKVSNLKWGEKVHYDMHSIDKSHIRPYRLQTYIVHRTYLCGMHDSHSTVLTTKPHAVTHSNLLSVVRMQA
jgi:hypothetical protein